MKFNLKGPFTPFPLMEDDETVYDYKSFWHWFVKHERRFVEMLKIDDQEENEFMAIFHSRLTEAWQDGGFNIHRCEDGIFEITFSISNDLKRAIIAEDFVAAAPVLARWRFSAFIKPLKYAEFKAVFNGFTVFSKDVGFFSTQHAHRPDMVDITVIFKNDDESYHHQIADACGNFIRSIIGELEMLTQFDSIAIRPASANDPELIPVAKLPAFLSWRQKEFVEKYQGVYYDKKVDRGERYLLLQSAPTSKGIISLTTVDRPVMRWNETVSYPWVAVIALRFKGADKGQPDDATRAAINFFQKDLGNMLDQDNDNLFLLHDTYDSVNTTYIACNEFREISRLLDDFLRDYQDQFEISYNISLDKYWKAVDAYRPACLMS